ncbi:hypothetical protein IW261DRAFT_593747 [Armillaria novae-zelandiae]|uniref:Uncharacterized protein n=1 Tax=Armillaria novae-zelandiae TaxID=153914 RepID=A0AA39PMT0_9AGAR|nr:hypothetical protein IW261DRAFT_593747 [Armillaria novae-zelandiae]
MHFLHRKRQIVLDESSSSSSLALSSSSTPAQAVGSPSNDAASVKGKGKGKFSKLWHRGKRGHTDTTGDVAATLPTSESPALRSNSSTVTSQPLDNAQTMTTKGSPDNTHVADTLSGNKTANVTLILGIVQTICDALDGVPYVGMVAGLASTAIKVIEVCHQFAVSWWY